MIGGLTYSDFAELMLQFEKDCTGKEIDQAWALWCRQHEAPRNN